MEAEGSFHIAAMTSFLALALAILPTISCEQRQEAHLVDRVQSTPPAFFLTAEQLAQEFGRNAVAAKSKYVDKVIVVQGKVAEIQLTGWVDEPDVVKLKGTLEMLYVFCWFSGAEQRSVAQLAKGQHVRIKGVCRFGVVWLELRRCRLQ